jgi:hypothetical protein
VDDRSKNSSEGILRIVESTQGRMVLTATSRGLPVVELDKDQANFAKPGLRTIPKYRSFCALHVNLEYIDIPNGEHIDQLVHGITLDRCASVYFGCTHPDAVGSAIVFNERERNVSIPQSPVNGANRGECSDIRYQLAIVLRVRFDGHYGSVGIPDIEVHGGVTNIRSGINDRLDGYPVRPRPE